MNDRHRARMARKKQVMDERIARAETDRGVVVVLTGNGKGKSSSAFGMALRALGHGLRVGIIQFVKGGQQSGEQLFFQNVPDVAFHVLGEGFSWESQDRERDRRAARHAWAKAAALLADPGRDLIVLDELNIAVKQGLLPLAEVITALRERPRHQHVIVTGRGAKDELLAAADTVSNITDVKHAFRSGVRAQRGIEW